MNNLSSKRRSQLLFFISIVALPVLQFVIFYIVVNFRSILFAFQKYSITDGYGFNGLNNFRQVINNLKEEEEMVYSIRNSLLLYVFTTLVGTGGALVFSNYIYKKYVGAKVFQITLFLPHIISAVVLVTVYKFFMDQGVPILHEKIKGESIDPLLYNLDTQYIYVLIFSLWMSFGTSVLMYTSTMSGISQEIVESAELDGVSPLREFVSITIPMIYPTLVTFMTVGVAQLFTNQMNVFSFYGKTDNKSLYTFGYYIYRRTLDYNETMDFSGYTYLSAVGLMMTAVALPLTLIVKRVMEKLGPSVD